MYISKRKYALWWNELHFNQNVSQSNLIYRQTTTIFVILFNFNIIKYHNYICIFTSLIIVFRNIKFYDTKIISTSRISLQNILKNE